MNITKQKWTHREQISGYQWGEGRGEETTMYKINKYRDILYSTRNINKIL